MFNKVQEIKITFKSLSEALGLPEGTFVVGVSEELSRQVIIKVVSDVEAREMTLDKGDDIKLLGEAFKK